MKTVIAVYVTNPETQKRERLGEVDSLAEMQANSVVDRLLQSGYTIELKLEEQQ